MDNANLTRSSAKSKRRLKYTPDALSNKNKISTPPMYSSPSGFVDSPPTPEIRCVEKIVDQMTPRRIPDKRRKLLVKSLFSFGVESLDDLKGFTYEELRQEMSLYAFTGVQLKRLLRQAQEYEEEQSLLMENSTRRSIANNSSSSRRVIVTRRKKTKKRNKKFSSNKLLHGDTIKDSMSEYDIGKSNSHSSATFASIAGAVVVGAVIAFGVHSLITTATDALEQSYQVRNNTGRENDGKVTMRRQ